MKKIIVLLFAFIVSTSVFSQNIIKDSTSNGVRYIKFVPDKMVCSNNIDIEINGDTIIKVEFTRGCSGNAKGIGALIKGMKCKEAIKRLEGISCGKRATSCPDQLAIALKDALSRIK